MLAIPRIWLLLTVALMAILAASASEGNPSTVATKLIEVSAKELAANADGLISYDHVKIVGDLDLSQAKYDSIKVTNSIIDGNVSFSNQVFDGYVGFQNTSFLKSVTLFQTIFNRETNFNGSRFYGAGNFSGSTFLDGATLDHCEFYENVNIKASNFPKFISFHKATFRGAANFGYSQFAGLYANFESSSFLNNAIFANIQSNTYLTFVGSRFLKSADFHATNFNLEANFMNTEILGDSSFNRSEFVKQAIFYNVSFKNATNFINTKFDVPSTFKEAQFLGNTYFTSAQFLGPSDFTNTLFEKNLTLNGATINTMYFDGCRFNKSSRLYLAKADINRFMANWSLIKDILSFDSSAYLSLVKNYKDMGLGTESNDCYYQYRYISQQSKGWGWSKLMDIFAQISCGYGVRPFNPVLCSVALIIICTGILWRGNSLRSPAHMEKRTTVFDALYYCFAVFFTIPLPDLKPQGRFRYVAVLERALAWTLFALLIGTLGKVMIG
jgi:hypothetical protein